MPVLAREVDAVQNPALGASLLWRFAVGYSGARKVPESTPLPILFVVLPLLYHEESARLITSTRLASGLRAFVGKFSDSTNVELDLLLALQRRAHQMRRQTLEALRLAVSTRLLTLERASAEVIVLSRTEPSKVASSIQSMMRNAEKLGGWFGAVSVFELASQLHVRF